MSKQKPDQDDLRPEYDFSQGTRGKHATRFVVPREGPAPAWMREAIQYDRQAWISEALRRLQEVEILLVVYHALAFDLEPADAGKDVSHLLEDLDGQALNRLSTDLAASSQAPARELRSGLNQLVRERSWLVHRSLYQQAEEANLKTAGGFTARLQRLSSEAAAMKEQLQKLVLARFRRAGMTQTEFERKAKTVTQQWLAA
jgi:hypothetical protein